MEKKITFRLFPSEKQKKLFDINFRCTRIVYNYFAELVKNDKEIGVELSEWDYDKYLPPLKNSDDFAFLKEPDSKTLQGAINKLFKDMGIARRFKKDVYPVYKLRKNQKNFYRVLQDQKKEKAIYLCAYGLKLPKVGFVQLNQKCYISPNWKISGADIYQTYTDKYYAKITFDCVDDEE